MILITVMCFIYVVKASPVPQQQRSPRARERLRGGRPCAPGHTFTLPTAARAAALLPLLQLLGAGRSPGQLRDGGVRPGRALLSRFFQLQPRLPAEPPLPDTGAFRRSARRPAGGVPSRAEPLGAVPSRAAHKGRLWGRRVGSAPPRGSALAPIMAPCAPRPLLLVLLLLPGGCGAGLPPEPPPPPSPQLQPQPLPESAPQKPTVLLAIIARNAAHALPHFLGCIERLRYPKSRIALW